MSYTSGFFDAVDLGGGEYDREYSAAVFAHYFSLLVKNGVFPDPSTGMQVKASSSPDMHVSVQPGSGWINGYYITVPENSPEVLTVPTANPSLSRIDSVIMGLNYVEREIQLYIKPGAVSASPSPVPLQRDNDLYELELAQISLSAGLASVTQSVITDKRQDSSRCGIVKGTIDQIDTTDLFAQYDDAFQTWFEDIQAQLSDDVATNLQNQITALKTGKLSVDSKASVSEAETGTDDTKYMTPAKVKTWTDKTLKPTLDSLAQSVPLKADLARVQKISLNRALERAIEYGRLSYQSFQTGIERNAGYKLGSDLTFSGNAQAVGETGGIGSVPYNSRMTASQKAEDFGYFQNYSSSPYPGHCYGMGFKCIQVGLNLSLSDIRMTEYGYGGTDTAFQMLSGAIVRYNSAGTVTAVLKQVTLSNPQVTGPSGGGWTTTGTTLTFSGLTYTTVSADVGSYIGFVIYGVSNYRINNYRQVSITKCNNSPSQGVGAFDGLSCNLSVTSLTYTLKNIFDLGTTIAFTKTVGLTAGNFPAMTISITGGSPSGSVTATMTPLNDSCEVEAAVVEASDACTPELYVGGTKVQGTVETESGQSANGTSCTRSILKATTQAAKGSSIKVVVNSSSALTVYNVCTKAT